MKDKKVHPAEDEDEDEKKEKLQSKFAPKYNAEWIKGLSEKGLISEEKAEELTRNKPSPGQEIGKGTTPLAQISRPGHFDFTPEALRPDYRVDPTTLDPDEQKEIALPVKRNSLQRSSTSIVAEEERQLVDQDEEVGKLGCQFYCVRQHQYRVSKVLRTQEEANLFATMLLVAIVIWGSCRSVMVTPEVDWNLDKTYVLWIILGILTFLYAGFIYISGVCRRHPFHLIMIASKSITWAFMCFVGCGLVDYYFLLKSCVETDEDFTDDKDDLANKILFAKCLDITEEHDETNYTNAPFFTFFAGLCLGYIYLLLYCLIVAFTKQFNLFGPVYPFLSYTCSWIIATISTGICLHNLFNFNPNQIVFNMMQCLAATLIATTIPQMFIAFVIRLVQGHHCPLQPKEWFYAAAQY